MNSPGGSRLEVGSDGEKERVGKEEDVLDVLNSECWSASAGHEERERKRRRWTPEARLSKSACELTRGDASCGSPPWNELRHSPLKEGATEERRARKRSQESGSPDVRIVGDSSSKEDYACSFYLTCYDVLDESVDVEGKMEVLARALEGKVKGKVRIQRTLCGLMVAFTRQLDADQVTRLPLADILASPVQVARFRSGNYKFCNTVVVKDVPWCISNLEIYHALRRQKVRAGRIARTSSNVKVEVLNSLHAHKLVEEGLNFFDHTSFAAEMEHASNQPAPDILQCFRCQGFWHTSARCRQMPRCVRCGENHDVEYCHRPRNSPVCCHCGGAHHAAYKLCPVRLRHINSTYVGFRLARNQEGGPSVADLVMP